MSKIWANSANSHVLVPADLRLQSLPRRLAERAPRSERGDKYEILVGRRGDMIIRGGENVYPLEVENRLLEHPRVADAAVIGVPDRLLGEAIKEYVVPTDPADPPASEELRAFTRAALAGFKVPTQWEFVPSLPRNATGKLLRRQLGST